MTVLEILENVETNLNNYIKCGEASFLHAAKEQLESAMEELYEKEEENRTNLN